MISQKKIPTKPGSGLIFKDLLLQSYGRISWVTNRKGPIKSLKIRSPAIMPIDIVLRRSAGPVFIALLSKMLLAVATSLCQLLADHFFASEKGPP